MHNMQRVFIVVLVLVTVQSSEMHGMFGLLPRQNHQLMNNNGKNNFFPEIKNYEKTEQKDKNKNQGNTPSWVQWHRQAMKDPNTNVNTIERK